jgi:hypothetical protein
MRRRISRRISTINLSESVSLSASEPVEIEFNVIRVRREQLYLFGMLCTGTQCVRFSLSLD